MGSEIEKKREGEKEIEKEREVDRDVRVRERWREKEREGSEKRDGERKREGAREREVEREGKREMGNIHRVMLMLCSSAGGHSLRLLCLRSALLPHFCCCFHVLLRACQ
jgi:hypothetical protein